MIGKSFALKVDRHSESSNIVAQPLPVKILNICWGFLLLGQVGIELCDKLIALICVFLL
jgi:hypothetical protein